jgi:hypothetical protein
VRTCVNHPPTAITSPIELGGVFWAQHANYKPTNEPTMNITINIPALERLCDILDKGIRISRADQLAPADQPAPAAEEPIRLTPKVTNKKTPLAPEPAKEFVAEEDETPTLVVVAPTVESLTALAKQYIAYNTPAALRSLLDDAGIKGEKISTCSRDKYAAIENALQTALESVK